ncbi:MAG: glycosyltransferase [Anaerolineales bacterium]
MTDRSMCVCYFGTYRAEYSRNQIMIEGLRRNGVEVIECHEELWQGIEDRVEMASGGWTKPRFWLRVIRTYLRLIWRYRKISDHDILMVGYPGQFDVFLARVLGWMRGTPLVWDIFMSIYLIALERGVDRRSPMTVRLIRYVEKTASRLPELLILDTDQYVSWFASVHGVSADKFRLVPTGADDRIFSPTAMHDGDASSVFRVIYYGTFILNHGVEYVIEAARILADERSIQFELIGRGPDRNMAQALAEQYRLSSVAFTDWLEKSELVSRVAGADVCLGSFGITPQSLMTVQNKIYEGMAMAKAVITGDSPAVRQVLQDGEHIYLCERANPQALAKAITSLRDDPALRRRLARNGHRMFEERLNLAHNGKRLVAHLQEALAK